MAGQNYTLSPDQIIPSYTEAHIAFIGRDVGGSNNWDREGIIFIDDGGILHYSCALTQTGVYIPTLVFYR